MIPTSDRGESSIEPYPESHELLGFFESAPKIDSCDGIPEQFSPHTYQTQIGDDHIYCEITPGYSKMLFIWRNGGVALMKLNLERIASLSIYHHDGVEKLVARFDAKTELLRFELQLKPTIQIEWGNQAGS